VESNPFRNNLQVNFGDVLDFEPTLKKRCPQQTSL
jgi:hypothetical protein